MPKGIGLMPSGIFWEGFWKGMGFKNCTVLGSANRIISSWTDVELSWLRWTKDAPPKLASEPFLILDVFPQSKTLWRLNVSSFFRCSAELWGGADLPGVWAATHYSDEPTTKAKEGCHDVLWWSKQESKTWEKSAPPLSFSSMEWRRLRVRWIITHVSLLREPQTNALAVLWALGWRGGDRKIQEWKSTAYWVRVRKRSFNGHRVPK